MGAGRCRTSKPIFCPNVHFFCLPVNSTSLKTSSGVVKVYSVFITADTNERICDTNDKHAFIYIYLKKLLLFACFYEKFESTHASPNTSRICSCAQPRVVIIIRQSHVLYTL
ncbi:hypothetical protein RF11_02622 [Thelohanellus kitauei]|uniref:Uncharacterized protein n=1 Tax=Thelohanellus kitauei TaxID=669202 RepID=A0A0C2IG29_THEKT|nr:hypothetical protein RF11_02622 [Thelohanellus kitauei]